MVITTHTKKVEQQNAAFLKITSGNTLLFQTEVDWYSKNLKNGCKLYFFFKFLSAERAIPI